MMKYDHMTEEVIADASQKHILHFKLANLNTLSI